MDLDVVRQANRAMWTSGDFGVIAREVGRLAGEGFAAGLTLAAGTRVLDVACGTGNVAVPLARAGAAVTGLDLAPNLLEQARQRAAAEGLRLELDEGDAEQMPYAAGAFAAVVSMFGAMFAPRPEVVAEEMARVLRAGGLLAMANWTPASFTGEMTRVGARFVAPPAGMVPPGLWGDAAMATARLEPYFGEIRTEVVPMLFDLAMAPEAAVAMFRTYFGPMIAAFARLDGEGQAGLTAAMEALWRERNEATDPGRTLIRNEYLKVTGVRR